MIGLRAPDGVGEVVCGADLVDLLLAACDRPDGGGPPADGDIVVVTSKVVSKAEGRARLSTREAELPGQTERVVAQRGATSIVRNRLGLTMAAAGIDGSNVEPGVVLLLPEDPDASARRLRDRIRDRTGHTVGVVISDTSGRAWREGQTDIAIGAAGVRVIQSYDGQIDGYGNPLAVTAPALADEIAGAAELVGSKTSGRPFVIVSGLSDLVLDAEDPGLGAAALIRADERDFFGFGARQAVVRALAGAESDRSGFGSPATAAEMAQAVRSAFDLPVTALGAILLVERAHDPATAALAFAHGWSSDGDETISRLSPPGQ